MNNIMMNNIMMNKEMTKAILDGRKVQTRRVIKYGLYAIQNDMNDHSIEVARNYCDLDEHNNPELKSEMIKHAKYQKDEVIWVREPAEVLTANGNTMKMSVQYMADVEYKSINIPDRFIGNFDYAPKEWYIKPKWIREKQGIPNGCIKEMARIFLKITDVRVERLQDITLNDIKNEGIIGKEDDAFNRWVKLWNSTAPKGYKWEDNPYVFVYEFERVTNEP